jgi:hypothetical protein
MPAEREAAGRMRRWLGRFGQGDELEESAVELDEAVLRAPGVHVARSDLEAHAPVERGLSFKIAGGQNEMVDAAGRG